jgi:hypothetical protein
MCEEKNRMAMCYSPCQASVFADGDEDARCAAEWILLN